MERPELHLIEYDLREDALEDFAKAGVMHLEDLLAKHAGFRDFLGEDA